MYTVFCIYTVSFMRNCKHLNILAQIVISFTAILTFSAWNCRLDRYLISHLKSLYAFADGGYHSARLMPKGEN